MPTQVWSLLFITYMFLNHIQGSIIVQILKSHGHSERDVADVMPHFQVFSQGFPRILRGGQQFKVVIVELGASLYL